jgi:hypothetical protein
MEITSVNDDSHSSRIFASVEATNDDGINTTKDKEYYLTPEQRLFIRSGLVVEILDTVLPADGLYRPRDSNDPKYGFTR